MGPALTCSGLPIGQRTLRIRAVVVLDAAGQVVARMGDAVRLRGRAIPHSGDDPVYRQLINELPGDCIGAAWLVDGSEVIPVKTNQNKGR